MRRREGQAQQVAQQGWESAGLEASGDGESAFGSQGSGKLQNCFKEEEMTSENLLGFLK